MTDEERERAVYLVRRLSTGGFESEELNERADDELGRLLPDPHYSDLIFWPNAHPLSAGLTESELTPEKIVELACQYKPFSL